MFLLLYALVFSLVHSSSATNTSDHYSVLILGGGVAGVIAARSLVQEGINDFLIVEARSELGGRLQSIPFGEPGRQKTIELGPNWVQGTQTGNGPANPIWQLTKKFDVVTVNNDWNNISMSQHPLQPINCRPPYQQPMMPLAKLIIWARSLTLSMPIPH